MASFGKTPRPGDEPPPRRQHTPEELRVRETFNRAEHLKNTSTNGSTANNPSSEPQAAQVKSVFDEQSIRASLNQLGLDFQIFPIGEKPAEPNGRNQHREARLTELESERAIIRQRMIVAEQVAADAVREVKTITLERDTLLAELETLRLGKAQEAT